MGAASAVADVVGDVVGGAADAVGDVVGGVADAAGDVVGGVVDTVSDIGSSIDDFVNDNIPGGWTLPLVVAAAYATGGASLAGEAALAGEAEGLGAALEAAGGEAALEGAAANAGGMDALLGSSGVSDEVLAAANASADPIASLNSQMGWTLTEAAPALPPVVDAVGTPVEAPVGTPATLPAGTSLGDLAAGAAIGGAVGAVAQDLLTPDIPGAAPSVQVTPDKPDWSIKFDPHTEYKAAPTFDFNFSDVPTDYMMSSQMVPTDQQMIGPGNATYNSNMVQALRGNSAGKASDNTGFTLFQTK